MEKKRSVGVTVFGVIFIIAGFCFLFFAPVLYVTERRMPIYMYESTTGRIDKLEEFVNNNITDASRLYVFKGKIEAIKSELEEYRNKYVIGSQIESSAQLPILFAAVSGFMYIISGIMILMILSSGRVMLLTSLWGSVFTMLLFFGHIYNRVAYTMDFGNKLLILANEFLPQMKTARLSDAPINVIIGVLSNPGMLLLIVLFIGFVSSVFYYFTLPKVKEQFK